MGSTHNRGNIFSQGQDTKARRIREISKEVLSAKAQTKTKQLGVAAPDSHPSAGKADRRVNELTGQSAQADGELKPVRPPLKKQGEQSLKNNT